jgi:hypothetical protein
MQGRAMPSVYVHSVSFSSLSRRLFEACGLSSHVFPLPGGAVRTFEIDDPALDYLATVVRGADTSRRDLAPQCEGLYAISLGLSANFPDDHEMLRHGLVIYDALYTGCRKQFAAIDQPIRAQA